MNVYQISSPHRIRLPRAYFHMLNSHCMRFAPYAIHQIEKQHFSKTTIETSQKAYHPSDLSYHDFFHKKKPLQFSPRNETMAPRHQKYDHAYRAGPRQRYRRPCPVTLHRRRKKALLHVVGDLWSGQFVTADPLINLGDDRDEERHTYARWWWVTAVEVVI